MFKADWGSNGTPIHTVASRIEPVGPCCRLATPQTMLGLDNKSEVVAGAELIGTYPARRPRFLCRCDTTSRGDDRRANLADPVFEPLTPKKKGRYFPRHGSKGHHS